MANEPEKPIDPKAQEYARTLENLTLMQAEIDSLKEELGQHRVLMAQAFTTITVLAKAVQTLQQVILKQ